MSSINRILAGAGSSPGECRTSGGLTGAARDVDRWLFQQGFDSPLVRKLIAHYSSACGTPLMLTGAEMVACNPVVNIKQAHVSAARGWWQNWKFPDVLNAMRARGFWRLRDVTLTGPAGANTSGTLGQFTVHFTGTLKVLKHGRWSFDGVMDWYDYWNFDPKDFEKGGRSWSGEVLTRFANYALMGKGFEIRTPAVPVAQSDQDMIVRWEGGEPVIVPNRVMKLVHGVDVTGDGAEK